MNLKTRIANLEALAHERLAAAVAEASLPVEEPQSVDELRQLDLGTMTDLCLDRIRGRKTSDSEEFRRLCAHYRRLPFPELMRQFPGLWLRQRKLRDAQHEKLQQRRAQARAELALPEPEWTTDTVYDDQFRKAGVFRRLLGTFVWE